ncbi:hypothetical protein DOY81_014439, partial [Sarcophaga bullata]
MALGKVKNKLLKIHPNVDQRDPFSTGDMKLKAVPNTSEPLPVMVWFHGGGWECGSGISSFYGPDFLLNHDIVLVSANFRLGPLGFLSTETTDCAGN